MPWEEPTGEQFLEVLRSRDFDQLEGLFHPEAEFRALIPAGLREGYGPKGAVDWYRHWFGEVEGFEVVASQIGRAADRLRIGYRARVHFVEGWHTVEHQAYCTVSDGLIEIMDLLCSGFRPEREERAHPEMQN